MNIVNKATRQIMIRKQHSGNNRAKSTGGFKNSTVIHIKVFGNNWLLQRQVIIHSPKYKNI